MRADAEMTLAEEVADLDLDEVVAFARRLRRYVSDAEYRLLEWLEAVEAVPEKWSPSCAGTFGSWLRVTHVVDPSRYGRWKLARAAVLEPVLRRIGVNAGMQLVRLPEDKRAEAQSSMVATAIEEQMPLSLRTAQRIVEIVRGPIPRRRLNPCHDLEVQVVALRKALAILQRENASLKSKLKASRKGKRS